MSLDSSVFDFSKDPFHYSRFLQSMEQLLDLSYNQKNKWYEEFSDAKQSITIKYEFGDESFEYDYKHCYKLDADYEEDDSDDLDDEDLDDFDDLDDDEEDDDEDYDEEDDDEDYDDDDDLDDLDTDEDENYNWEFYEDEDEDEEEDDDSFDDEDEEDDNW